MQTTTLLNALSPAHEEGRRARQQGDFARAEQIDRTLIQIARPLSMAIDGDGGSLRTLRRLVDVEAPLPLDGLVTLTWPLDAALAAIR
jgi:hypothetical protein